MRAIRFERDDSVGGTDSTGPAKDSAAQREPLLVVMGVIEGPFCPREPQLLLALYEKMALFRSGGACPRQPDPILQVDLGPEERAQIGQDLDLNPLLGGARNPVEFCKGCPFEEVDIVAVRNRGLVGWVLVRGSGSGKPPADVATSAERDAALAAQNLLLSVDRIREWLATLPSRPWNWRAIVFVRVDARRGRTSAPLCLWPGAWPKPRDPAGVHTGETVAVETFALAEEELAGWMKKCEMRGALIGEAAFLVRTVPLIPGQVELGGPFAVGLDR